MVKIWLACCWVKFFCRLVRMSCPSWFRVWVAPYSLTVGGVLGVVWGFCLGGVSPCSVMRPRYCLVIFWARFLSLFQMEVTA